jgi:hypothetical protein
MGCRFSHILFFKPFLSIGVMGRPLQHNTSTLRYVSSFTVMVVVLFRMLGKEYGTSAVAAADDNSDLFVFVIPLQSKHFLLSFI